MCPRPCGVIGVFERLRSSSFFASGQLFEFLGSCCCLASEELLVESNTLVFSHWHHRAPITASGRVLLRMQALLRRALNEGGTRHCLTSVRFCHMALDTTAGKIQLQIESGSFRPTPASLVSLDTVAKGAVEGWWSGTGMDIGTGTGLLAIAAAKFGDQVNIQSTAATTLTSVTRL